MPSFQMKESTNPQVDTKWAVICCSKLYHPHQTTHTRDRWGPLTLKQFYFILNHHKQKVAIFPLKKKKKLYKKKSVFVICFSSTHSRRHMTQDTFFLHLFFVSVCFNIGATIRMHREIQCLPYTAFFFTF